MRHVTVMQAGGQDRTGTAADVSVRGLSCRRGGRVLFTGVDLHLTPGQAALVRGPNGVGKSSLLRLLCGLLPVFAGEVAITGGVSLADDRLALDADRPLRTALGFWGGIDSAAPAEQAEALAALDLASLSDVPVRMLSTGQRKRATLARTLASGAAVWLLDEPGNGLDGASLERLGTAVRAHLARGGIVIAASHMPLPWPADVERALAPPPSAPDEDWA